MKPQTKKIIFFTTVLVGLTTFIIIRKIQGNKIYNKLMENLKTGANKTGTTKDIKEGSQNWNSVTYWATAKPTLQNNPKPYQSIATDLYIQIHNVFVSSTSVFDTIKKIKNQAEASYVAYWYVKEKNKIGNILNKEQTLLQGIQNINKNVSAQIVNYLNNLPLK